MNLAMWYYYFCSNQLKSHISAAASMRCWPKSDCTVKYRQKKPSEHKKKSKTNRAAAHLNIIQSLWINWSDTIADFIRDFPQSHRALTSEITFEVPCARCFIPRKWTRGKSWEERVSGNCSQPVEHSSAVLEQLSWAALWHYTDVVSRSPERAFQCEVLKGLQGFLCISGKMREAIIFQLDLNHFYVLDLKPLYENLALFHRLLSMASCWLLDRR